MQQRSGVKEKMQPPPLAPKYVIRTAFEGRITRLPSPEPARFRISSIETKCQ